ncbi:bifunctional Glutaredoxin [Babesia duncani]|uniref:Bifunctional Glutaredoxin n=1 Tax=Babesia duncani TaxID=323732 RepID=A0AAD9PMU4_9APIC|nr:bifunctional Glutaredoxin [Babesia duncani]
MPASNIDVFLSHEAVKQANELINKNAVTVFTKGTCPYCVRVMQLFRDLKLQKMHEEDIRENPQQQLLKDYFLALTGASTVPRVFIGGKCVGGCDDVFKLKQDGKLLDMLREAGALSQ